MAYRYSPEVVRDSRSVLQVITGQTRLDVDFSIESEKDENGMAVLRLYPREPSTQMVEAVIWVDKDSNLIRKAQILDFYGNTNEVTLNSLTPDAPIPAGAFPVHTAQGDFHRRSDQSDGSGTSSSQVADKLFRNQQIPA